MIQLSVGNGLVGCGIAKVGTFVAGKGGKRYVYLSTYQEVYKFSDGTLVKIQENLIEMLSKNKLGSGNKRLNGRDWTDYDVRSSREMLKKIDEILRHREQAFDQIRSLRIFYWRKT
ncbi:hypothetical protein Tco_1121928 [Tanacetum coccineum]|uniref:Uncharacterized protein n=1 Tax=Tanacetum coccineum TaxID=301880 RepID=A0ABQ5IZ38_9ASTR